MLNFDEYAQRFENVELQRDEAGVITIRLHTKGGSLVYGERAHLELSWVFRCVADDSDNRVVVLTGTGDTFCTLINPPSFEHYQQTPQGWDRTLFEERRAIEGFLSIDVPIISAVNGPALVHSHLPVMADIVLASETACFSDSMHVPNRHRSRRRRTHRMAAAARYEPRSLLPADGRDTRRHSRTRTRGSLRSAASRCAAAAGTRTRCRTRKQTDPDASADPFSASQ